MATFLPSFAIFNFGGMELLLILFIVLLLFGAKRLPELAKGLGQSVKEFKKASQDDEAKPAAAEAAKPVETRKTGNGGSAPGAN